MHPAPFIFLAAGNGPGFDTVIWVVVGAIWLLSQLAAAKKKQRRKTDREATKPPFEVHRSEEEGSPNANELAEIFARLGADIPATPPPRPTAARPASPPAAPRKTRAFAKRKKVDYNAIRKPPPAPVRPEITQRLARVKREAEEAARQAARALHTPHPAGPYAASEQVETCSLATTDQSRGTILPRLYAMDLRLTPFPSIPMPISQPREIRLTLVPLNEFGYGPCFFL